MLDDRSKRSTKTPATKNWKLKIENSRRAGGYTLIEILVAISIVSLIFAIGYVSFRDFARRQAVAGAARTLVANLRLAQEQALSGQKPIDIFCNDPNILNGYNFRVVSSQKYVLEANCTGGNVQTKSVDLPADLFVSTPNPNPITFKILGQGTNIAGGSTTLTISQTATSHTRVVTVTEAGEIK